MYKTFGPSKSVPQSKSLCNGLTRKGKPQSTMAMPEDDDEAILRSYFRLDMSLNDLYEEWSSQDPNFKEVKNKYFGVRMLKQEPTENLFAFICSSNNNISR